MSKVAHNEVITRYIMKDSKWIRNNGTLRWNAFQPRRIENQPITLIHRIWDALWPRSIKNRLVTSIYRISNLADIKVWEIGVKCVAEPSEKKLIGRADLFAYNIYTNNLNFKPDDRPCKGHANIVGWPDEREDIKAIASELATESTIKYP